MHLEYKNRAADLEDLLINIIRAKGLKSRKLAVDKAREYLYPPIKNENTGAFWKERLMFWRNVLEKVNKFS